MVPPSQPLQPNSLKLDSSPPSTSSNIVSGQRWTVYGGLAKAQRMTHCPPIGVGGAALPRAIGAHGLTRGGRHHSLFMFCAM